MVSPQVTQGGRSYHAQMKIIVSSCFAKCSPHCETCYICALYIERLSHTETGMQINSTFNPEREGFSESEAKSKRPFT